MMDQKRRLENDGLENDCKRALFADVGVTLCVVKTLATALYRLDSEGPTL